MGKRAKKGYKEVACLNCGIVFRKRNGEIKKYPNHFCSLDCKNEHKKRNKNVELICEWCGEIYSKRLSVSLASRFCSNKCKCEHRGRFNLSTLQEKIRTCKLYLDWRKAVFERDNYICQSCGANDYIHAHHIKLFSNVIMKNNIRTLEQALECKELWDANNGITLCPDCHKDAHIKMKEVNDA